MHGMREPPAQLDGAEVLWWADLARASATGWTTHRVRGEVLGPAAGLAICRYAGDGEFYLFYCDAEWNVRTDTCHESVERAKAQAEFEYEGVGAAWRARVTASPNPGRP